MIRRSAVVIVGEQGLALIRRVNARGEYYLFPGGHLEEGETPEEAAIREAREELGVDVRLTGLLAVVTFHGMRQYFYAAEVVGGVFGTGTGEELASTPDSSRGTYTPVWVALDELRRLEVRPRALADRIALGMPALPQSPWEFKQMKGNEEPWSATPL